MYNVTHSDQHFQKTSPYSFQDLKKLATETEDQLLKKLQATHINNNFTKFNLYTLKEALNTECYIINVDQATIKRSKQRCINHCPLANAIQENKDFMGAMVYQKIVTSKTDRTQQVWNTGTTVLRATTNWDRNKIAFEGLLYLAKNHEESWYFATGEHPCQSQ